MLILSSSFFWASSLFFQRVDYNGRSIKAHGRNKDVSHKIAISRETSITVFDFAFVIDTPQACASLSRTLLRACSDRIYEHQ